jgi:hypothetical protein
MVRIGNPFEAAFIEAREVGDVCVAVIDERVLSDHQVDCAKFRLCELAGAHAGRLAVAMSKCDGSSMGLFAALLHVQDYCVQRRGRLVLFSLPKVTTRALTRFGLLESFTLAEGLEQAVEMLHRPDAPGARGSWLSQVLRRDRAAA